MDKQGLVAWLRFRWLCLPRWLRAVALSILVMSVVFSVFGLTLFIALTIIDWLGKTFGGFAATIMIVFVIMVVLLAVEGVKDMKPSIKRKDKPE